jgi:hypothetical protein
VLDEVVGLAIGVARATVGEGELVGDGAEVGVAPPHPASTTARISKPSQPFPRRCTVAIFSI